MAIGEVPPPSLFSQMRAVLLKEVQVARRAPLSTLLSVIAPGLLVFLMGINGMLSGPVSQPSEPVLFQPEVSGADDKRRPKVVRTNLCSH
jgi:hypothetical protein